MWLTSIPWNISKPRGRFVPPALPTAAMPAVKGEASASKPTVEIEDRNQADSEVAKESGPATAACKKVTAVTPCWLMAR